MDPAPALEPIPRPPGHLLVGNLAAGMMPTTQRSKP